MRNQFTFYKSFDDVIEDLSDKQIAEYIKVMLDVQFLRVKIDEVEFTDKTLSIVWKSQKHSISTSIKGYLDGQKRDTVKNPYLGVYDNSLDPTLGVRQQEKEKEKEKVQGKEKEEEEVKGKGKDIIVGFKQPTSVDIYNDSVNVIISHLNQVCNTGFKSSSQKTKSLIQARLKDGFTLEDFKKVHITKYAEWNGTDMQKYLRPETLYGTKFESYLNQKLTNNEKYRAISEHTGMSALEMLKREGRA